MQGIETVVLERRTPEYLCARVRADLLEQVTVNLLTEAGAGERLAREGLIHNGSAGSSTRLEPGY
jgi:p-hydroxybenzoate 3-monooxygenase